MKRVLPIAAALLLAGCDKIPNAERQEIAAAEKLVADELRDPDSAQFRNVAKYETDDDKGGKLSFVCGEVNGKNLNGAYVGFKRFIANVELGGMMIDPATGLVESDIQDAIAQCKREVAVAQRLGAGAPITMYCEEAKRKLEEWRTQVEFDADHDMFCAKDPASV